MQQYWKAAGSPPASGVLASWLSGGKILICAKYFYCGRFRALSVTSLNVKLRRHAKAALWAIDSSPSTPRLISHHLQVMDTNPLCEGCSKHFITSQPLCGHRPISRPIAMARDYDAIGLDLMLCLQPQSTRPEHRKELVTSPHPPENWIWSSEEGVLGGRQTQQIVRLK